MALTYDQISSITEKKFIPKLYDNVYDSNPLLQRSKDKFKEKIDGGERIVVPLLYAQTTASGTYSGSDTLDTTDNQVNTAAEYTWKQYYANISLSGLDELKNSGDSAVINLAKTKTKNAQKTLEDLLGTGVYSSGSDPKAIVGLRVMASTSNSVGGISQSTYSWWASNVDSSTTTLTIAAMQAQDTEATVNSDTPSVIMTTRTLYNSYYALLQPQQRFTDKETGKGGFTSLMFNGKPVIPDSHCPASHMFFLNEDYLHLFVHSQRDMKFEPFQKPINQDVRSAKVLWAGALGYSNNRMHAALTAVTA